MKVKRFIKVRRNGVYHDEKERFYVGSKNFQSEDHTSKKFLNCKERLFHISAWNGVPGLGDASFSLYGRNGNPTAAESPAEGDFIRIDFPDLFPVFWMRVEHVVENSDVAELITAPVGDPTAKGSGDAAIESLQKAQSIFRVEKQDNSVFAIVINFIESQDDYMLTDQSEDVWKSFLERPWKNLAEYVVGNSDN